VRRVCLSGVEKQKEDATLFETRKKVEQQRIMNQQQKLYGTCSQLEANVGQERELLSEQNERQAREWKERTDFAASLVAHQIEDDHKSGFDNRAEELRKELNATTDKTRQMMLEMQKQHNESQHRMDQLLHMVVEKQRRQVVPPQQFVEQKPSGGLLSSLLGGLL